MKTILLASRKGGSGKTTIAAHLAVQAQLTGEKVTVVDLDPQQSLAAWWKARQLEDLQLAQFPVARFKDELDRVRGVEGVLIVDTPGFEATELQPLMEAADFVVIPVQPTPNDLRAVGQTVRTVKQAGSQFCFVITRGKAGTRLTQLAPLELSHHGPVATTIVIDRTDYAGAMATGQTIQEIDPKGKGAEETAQLWDYVRKRLSGNPLAQSAAEEAHV
jgi:chromosome partitioning protein